MFDFSEDGGVYGYGHGGIGCGYSSGVSYSVGLVENMNEPDDYSGAFVDVNGGYNMGFDHAFSPEGDYKNAVKSSSFTFGSGYNFGVGRDRYSAPVIFKKWG